VDTVATMSLSQADCVTAITEHSAGFAAAARGRLDARVEHCPGWSVADLVAHVVGVHWFWAEVVEQRLHEPPSAEHRPQRPDDDDLLATFEAGAERLVRILGDAEPQERVWTWAPAQQDGAFVIRHQVQEIAVHHWDAAHAVGETVMIGADAAADAVEEFLTVSVSSAEDPADPARPALGGTFALRCTDTPAQWRVSVGAEPGTVLTTAGAGHDLPAISATASDLLLWLYERVALDPGDVDRTLLKRFRALTYTD